MFAIFRRAATRHNEHIAGTITAVTSGQCLEDKSFSGFDIVTVQCAHTANKVRCVIFPEDNLGYDPAVGHAVRFQFRKLASNDDFGTALAVASAQRLSAAPRMA